MKLAWPVEITGTTGPAMGYRLVAEQLRAALEAAGVTWDPDARIALHLTPPHLFLPVAGRVNVLFSMWETTLVPEDQLERARRADLVIVPSWANERMLREAGLTGVVVVPLGLHPAHQAPITPREAAPWPFRFLWVGQASVRKGWDLVNTAFAAAFPGRSLGVQLTLKTMPSGDTPEFECGGRVRVIARRYTDAEMAGLYRGAHAFVFPTRGEGFGLPAAEAMAAECLLLAPPVTGLADFVDDTVAWTLPWRPVGAWYGVPCEVPEVPVEVLAGMMRRAVQEYARTGRLRSRARTRALTMTWEQTARGVLGAIARPAAQPRVTSQSGAIPGG